MVKNNLTHILTEMTDRNIFLICILCVRNYSKRSSSGLACYHFDVHFKVISTINEWELRKKNEGKKSDSKILGKVFSKKVRPTPKSCWLKSGRSLFFWIFFKKCLKNFHTNSKTQPKLPYRFPWFFLLFKQPPLTHQFAKFQASGFFRSRVRSRIKS